MEIFEGGFPQQLTNGNAKVFPKAKNDPGNWNPVGGGSPETGPFPLLRGTSLLRGSSRLAHRTAQPQLRAALLPAQVKTASAQV
jgi:hypothetical protein